MNHYVYEIINKINGKKYIGKRSCECDIEKDKYMGSGVILLNAKRKYGKENFIRMTIETLSSEEEAYEREKYWIKYYDAVKSRMYYNIKDGGQGNSRGDMLRIMNNLTPEQKAIRGRKLSIANKGIKNSMYGIKGKDNPRSKSVVMLSDEGELVSVFECLREASEYLKTSIRGSLISRVCRDKYGTAYGYLWLFKEDYLRLKATNKLKEWVNYNKDTYMLRRDNFKKASIIHNSKPIYKLNKHNFKIIDIYDSIVEASKQNKILKSSISRNCRHGSNTAGGYTWIFVDEYNKLNIEQLNILYSHKYTPKPKGYYEKQKKKVICLNTNKIFDGIVDARIYYNMCVGAKIEAVCRGKRASAGKDKNGTPLKWMYYNEYINEIEQAI